jgi:phospholipid-binding lipoprotein MlaA
MSKKVFGAFALVVLLTGCATSATHQKDPLEGFNRAMFRFNDAVDEAVLKPVATGYQKVTPSFVQTAIGNFFGNLGDVWTSVNNFLQGNVHDGVSDAMRVAVNSTMGFGGILDIASEAGMTKHREDFGQTLGVWGVPSGPYLVLPLIGSSTIRDTAALPADFAGDPWQYDEVVGVSNRVRNTGTALRIVDERAALLGASNLLDDVALDKYAFVRDAWLQRRESLIGREGSSRPFYYDDFDEEDLELDDTLPGPATVSP